MRTKYSLINMLVSVGGQIPNTVLTLVVRIVFVRYLAVEYLGVNGLFSNILSVLSLAELGIGPAMTYSLYKPVAEGNQDEITRLMNLYRRMYRAVALVVLLCGLSLIPFLDYLIKDRPDIEHLTLFYLLYLANSVTTYFFGYKQAIITAYQKAYINVAYTQMMQILKSVLQIVILVCTGSFILYLAVQIICSLITNVLLARKADGMYPYMAENKKALPIKEDRQRIYRDIRAMCFHKVGAILIGNTDNLVISAYIGLSEVGIYSNYLMLVNHLKTLLGYIYGSFNAGIGNLSALESKESVYKVYRTLNMLMFIIFGYSAAALFVLLNPFMDICFGVGYVFSVRTVLLIVLDFYIWGMRQLTLKFRDAQGLFWHDRYKPFFEVTLNLGISIFLAQKYGVDGVVLGTIISTLLTSFWIEPYVLMRYGLEEAWKEKLYRYYCRYFQELCLLVVCTVFLSWCCSLIKGAGLLPFLLKGIICTAGYFAVIIAVMWRTEEFQSLKTRIVQTLNTSKNQ